MDSATLAKFLSERKKKGINACVDKANNGRLYITNERKPSDDPEERQQQLESLVHYKIYGDVTKGVFTKTDLTDELNQDILQQAEKDYDVVHKDSYVSSLTHLLFLQKGEDVNECQKLLNETMDKARAEWKDAGLFRQ